MQKLICKPGQRATIVRSLPGMSTRMELIGRIVRVVRIMTPQENYWILPEFPCWKIETPILVSDKEYVGVYDYCLAPLPDEGDVWEFDHEEDLVKEQNKELSC